MNDLPFCQTPISQHLSCNKFIECSFDINFTEVDHLSERLSEPPTLPKWFRGPWVSYNVHVVVCTSQIVSQVHLLVRYPEDPGLHTKKLPAAPVLQNSGDGEFLNFAVCVYTTSRVMTPASDLLPILKSIQLAEWMITLTGCSMLDLPPNTFSWLLSILLILSTTMLSHVN